MRTGLRMHWRATGLLLCALTVASVSPLAFAQESPTTQLLSKAHALELRGRMDMAKQTWAQVLLADPNNTEALAGMARAAKSQGKIDEANQYLAQLRSINPSDPNIARVENMGTARDTNVLLKQAGELSQQGQYSRAMAILKQVYGNQPPRVMQPLVITRQKLPLKIRALRPSLGFVPWSTSIRTTHVTRSRWAKFLRTTRARVPKAASCSRAIRTMQMRPSRCVRLFRGTSPIQQTLQRFVVLFSSILMLRFRTHWHRTIRLWPLAVASRHLSGR